MLTVMDGKNEDRNEQLFDNSVGYDDESGIKFAKDLTEEERRQATSLYRLFNGLWGIVAVKGDPGTGKDLFCNYLVYKLKKFFPQKRIIRDERPRALFGEYDAFFDEEVIINDVKNMTSIAKGEKDNKTKEIIRLDKAADDWLKGAGEVLLKNSITYLTEWWKYCSNREPHSPMNKTMGAIHRVKRHLDMLLVGSTQDMHDLDRFTCLPYVDWQVTCTRSTVNKTGFAYFVQKVKYDKRLNSLVPTRRPFPIRFDAGKPRSDMGDGKIVITKDWYKPETEEEEIVLSVIKSGINVYEEIVDYIDEYGDMSEEEVLETIKDLSFIPRKHVLDFPCYFRLYNSKSAPAVKTRLKLEE